ncbi:MAG: hypothetical protein GY698_07795 [Actinomycetia bacterium]|nr:hypothetical protein [Actinomycetes bacterium]
MSRDRERDLQAARLGWQTLRVTWEMVMGDPVQVGRDVAAVHAIRLNFGGGLGWGGSWVGAG